METQYNIICEKYSELLNEYKLYKEDKMNEIRNLKDK